MFLVTGANGFIGSQVVQSLVEKGSKVVVYHSHPVSTRLAPVADKIEFVNGDLMEWETLSGAIKDYGVETIVHLAYYRDIVEQEKRPLKATRINCLGFNNVLEVARLSGVKRVGLVEFHSGLWPSGALHRAGKRGCAHSTHNPLWSL